MKSENKRKEAIEWWSKLSFINKQLLTDKYFVIRKQQSLIGNEIEIIYTSENKHPACL